MNRKEIKEKLKAELPFGYIKLITEKLKKTGISYSRGTISTALNPESDSWNATIINAAHDVVIDSRNQDIPLAKKIAAL